MASAVGDTVEVNLTPMLDLVLQLIMFFMITVRLVAYETSNEEIDLPHTQLSLPKEDAKKMVRFPVWVNLDSKGTIVGLPDKATRSFGGDVVVPSKDGAGSARSRKDIEEVIKSYFDVREYELSKQARAMGLKEDEYKIGVVIRADRRCRYDQVWTLMDIVQQGNYKFWQISVLNLGS
ncbi:MAG: biopolymer transporter ExbD [Gemmataceae bacterium]